MDRKSPKNSQTLIKAAWGAYARGDDTEVEMLFRQILEIEPNSIETLYGLALVLKAQGQHLEVIHLFEEIVRKIDSCQWEDRNRVRMLRRLAVGQVNYLRNQDWNLEREVWQR